MLTLSGSRLQRLIRPLGKYRQNAKRIRMISKRLLQEYDGKVPDTLEALLALPGVGRKTANIVLEHAFGQPTIAVDTHVHRVARRLGLVPPKASAEKAHELLEAQLTPEQVYPFHIQLIKHGRRTCSAQRPKCPACPLRKDCPSAAGVFDKGLGRRKATTS